MNASQGAHSIVMSCEAPADERDCELGRSLVFIQFKDFYFLQIATEEGSVKETVKRKFVLERTDFVRCLLPFSESI